MAFSYTTEKKTVFGDMRCHMGTFTGTSVSTGSLVTGLRQVWDLQIAQTGVSKRYQPTAMFQSVPSTTGTIRIDFPTGATGTWKAIGY